GLVSLTRFSWSIKQALPDFQPIHSPLSYGRERTMVPGISEPPPRERHRVVMYQQESLAFGGVPTLCAERQLAFNTAQSPLNPAIQGVSAHLPDHWFINFQSAGVERTEEPPPPSTEERHMPPECPSQDRQRSSSMESDGEQPETPNIAGPENSRPVYRTSQGSDKAKAAWRKLRLYLPDISSSAPVQPSEDDSVFSEPEDPRPPSAADVKETPEPQEAVVVAAAGGKVEQERWRFSASELISKLQLSQRRNNFTAKIGKSLSTKITLREKGASTSQEGKSGRRERRCNSAGVSSLLQPPARDTDSSWLRSKSVEGGQQGRPPSEEARPSPCEERPEDTESQRRQSYCERRQSRFLLTSILYQEYSDVAINRELQRQKREDTAGEEDDVSASPKSNLSPSSSFRSQRSSRGSTFSLWQDIPDVRGSGVLNTLTIQERKLQEAKFELVTSEASYVNSLSIVVDHFLNSPELNECLGAQEKQWLFSKLPEVKEISERFLTDLEERLEEDILRFDVCDIVLRHCPELRRVYLPYVTNQAYQEQTYQRLLQENARFRGILAKLEEDQVCQRLPLTSFLILPFQRIMRLKMLVENILKHTAPGSQNEETASQAFTELKKLVKECNASVQSMKRTEELIHLNKKIHFESKIFPLISQSRWLVKHGELVELDMQIPNAAGSRFKLSPKPVYLHLFNDCLLLSRKKELGRFAVFAHAQVCDLKVTDLSWKLQEVRARCSMSSCATSNGRNTRSCFVRRARARSSAGSPPCVPPSRSSTWRTSPTAKTLLRSSALRGTPPRSTMSSRWRRPTSLRLTAKTSDGWMEGIRLSDGERGWAPATHVEEITNKNARLRNLRENKRIKHATSKLEMKPP
ncbi:unnamed protein product, partial [Staurois parvus]